MSQIDRFLRAACSQGTTVAGTHAAMLVYVDTSTGNVVGSFVPLAALADVKAAVQAGAATGEEMVRALASGASAIEEQHRAVRRAAFEAQEQVRAAEVTASIAAMLEPVQG